MKPLTYLALLVGIGTSCPTLTATTISSYGFTGTCTVDCTGTGRALLVLTDYILGSPLQTNNFVSFQYSSDFMPSFSITPQDLVLITGVLPASLPNPAEVFINAGNGVFFSHTNQGFWCVGIRCAADAGNNGVWAAVPEPGTYWFTLSAGLAFLWRRSAKPTIAWRRRP
jgi:hypothetical protein